MRIGVGILVLGVAYGGGGGVAQAQFNALKKADARAEAISLDIQKALPKFFGNRPRIFSSDWPVFQKLVALNMIKPPLATSYESFDYLLPHLPAPPDAMLKTRLRDFMKFATDSFDALSTLIWLPPVKLGAVSGFQRSAHCQSWTVFTSDGRQTYPAPLPLVLANDLCSGFGNTAYLGLAGHQAVALAESAAPAKFTIALQVWDGAEWSKPSAFSADLNLALDPKPIFVSCADSSCGDIIKLGRSIAEKVDHHEGAAAISVPLSPAEAKQFALVQQNDRQDTMVLPDIGSQRYSGLSGFDSESMLFPATLDGRLIFGRISHGSTGWRVDDHWNLGFWRLDGTKLAPVGALVFAHRLSKITSISTIPNWRAVLH